MKSSGFETRSRQRDTRGRQNQDQAEGPLLLVRDVEGAGNYVSTCSPCSRNKRPQRHARAEMLKYYAGAPMQGVHLDFL